MQGKREGTNRICQTPAKADGQKRCWSSGRPPATAFLPGLRWPFPPVPPRWRALEKPAAGSRTATAGWYNTAAFEEFAQKDGLYAKSVNGDAFSKEVKDQVIGLIKQDLGTGGHGGI